jgi:PAS domain S-box-containing protein
MSQRLRILSIEDDPKDIELIQDVLANGDIVCDVTRIDTRDAMLAAMAQGGIDLILADYTLPSFDGISALKLALKICPEVPFIFVSGTLGEEVAIEALKLGATDYVLKTRLSRLVPSAARALREATEREERKKADDKLRKSQAYLAEAQTLSRTGTFGWDVPSAEIFWSPETFRIFQYDPTVTVTVELVLERTHPEDRAKLRQLIERVSRDKTAFDIEHRLQVPDGSVKHVRVVGRPSEKAGGGAKFVGAITDITERKAAEAALRRSAEQLTAQSAQLDELFEQAPEGIVLLDVEDRVLRINPEFTRIFGYTPDEAVGRPINDLIAWEELRRGAEEYTNRIIHRKTIHAETICRRKDGGQVHISLFAVPISVPGGQIGKYAIYSDITKRKRAEEALRRSEAYLTEAQRLSRTGSFGWDVSTGKIYWSQETFRIFECEPAAGATIELVMQRTHPEDRSLMKELINRVSREKTAFDFEHRLLIPDGKVKYVRVVGRPSEKEGGGLEFVGAVTDITQSKRAEEALRRSESYLAEAQRLTRSGSWAWDVGTGSLFWSQEIFRIYEFDPEKTEATWPHFLARVHPEDRPAVEQRAKLEVTQKELTNSEADFRAVLPDGTIKHIHTIAHPVINESGAVTEVVGTVMDVTEQYEARAALEAAFEQIKTLRDQLYKENIALREEIDRSSMFEEIVGESPALQVVLASVTKVAPTESTVLITGETGTGKELIARAIHKRSQRAACAFISVNCAAIPPSLIASELFGHEKGAFTGALQRRLGRFELAEGGTIFLDEIGELPMETQIALLRVLQEREFERVGGSKAIHANVRVIAATNRDLARSIEAGVFRGDLYYRLNVFPIEMPPLRKRKEDIPLLVEYFIDRYTVKAAKKIRGINRAALDRLVSYAWPGNIRELQNVIERSVVLCETENLTVDERWLSEIPVEPNQAVTGLLTKIPASQEKQTIEAALAHSRGRVSGPSGAAAKLGIPASTLESKIRSLRINKHRFKAK